MVAISDTCRSCSSLQSISQHAHAFRVWTPSLGGVGANGISRLREAERGDRRIVAREIRAIRFPGDSAEGEYLPRNRLRFVHQSGIFDFQHPFRDRCLPMLRQPSIFGVMV